MLIKAIPIYTMFFFKLLLGVHHGKRAIPCDLNIKGEVLLKFLLTRTLKMMDFSNSSFLNASLGNHLSYIWRKGSWLLKEGNGGLEMVNLLASTLINGFLENQQSSFCLFLDPYLCLQWIVLFVMDNGIRS